MDGSQYRTYSLTRCVITVLTHHWLVHHSDIFIIRTTQALHLFLFIYTGFVVLLSIILVDRIITVNSQPMHFPATSHFITTHHRNVVLYITCYNTRTTTGTGIEINCHHPAVTRLLIFIPQIISLVLVNEAA